MIITRSGGTREKQNETPRRAVYPGRKEQTMTEREIERILAEEADEEKVLEAIEGYLKGAVNDN